MPPEYSPQLEADAELLRSLIARDTQPHRRARWPWLLLLTALSVATVCAPLLAWRHSPPPRPMEDVALPLPVLVPIEPPRPIAPVAPLSQAAGPKIKHVHHIAKQPPREKRTPTASCDDTDPLCIDGLR